MKKVFGWLFAILSVLFTMGLVLRLIFVFTGKWEFKFAEFSFICAIILCLFSLALRLLQKNKESNNKDTMKASIKVVIVLSQAIIVLIISALLSLIICFEAFWLFVIILSMLMPSHNKIARYFKKKDNSNEAEKPVSKEINQEGQTESVFFSNHSNRVVEETACEERVDFCDKKHDGSNLGL